MAHEFQRADGSSRGTPVASPPEEAADLAAAMPGVPEAQRQRRTLSLRYALYGLLVLLLGLGLDQVLLTGAPLGLR